MKLRTVSGRVSVSLTQVPGRGSGTRLDRTGSQADDDEACSLNLPLKADWMSVRVNEQIAEPIRPLVEVVNVP
jgi:hypothetical protein